MGCLLEAPTASVGGRELGNEAGPDGGNGHRVLTFLGGVMNPDFVVGAS